MPIDLINTADNGTSTMMDRYSRVNPKESPKPGNTRLPCDMEYLNDDESSPQKNQIRYKVQN
jgi:hypothetical protein